MKGPSAKRLKFKVTGEKQQSGAVLDVWETRSGEHAGIADLVKAWAVPEGSRAVGTVSRGRAGTGNPGLLGEGEDWTPQHLCHCVRNPYSYRLKICKLGKIQCGSSAGGQVSSKQGINGEDPELPDKGSPKDPVTPIPDVQNLPPSGMPSASQRDASVFIVDPSTQGSKFLDLENPSALSGWSHTSSLFLSPLGFPQRGRKHNRILNRVLWFVFF